MAFPDVTYEAWRAQVDKELAGKPFDKVLVGQTPEKIAIQPLYIAAPADVADRSSSGWRLRICVRATGSEIAEEIEGGADTVWTRLEDLDRLEGVSTRFEGMIDVDAVPSADAVEKARKKLAGSSVLGFDPIASGRPVSEIADAYARVSKVPGGIAFVASSTRYHEAGADAVLELALLLATATRYLEVACDAGASVSDVGSRMLLRMSVGRDTFLELCKLRALRICWQKILKASANHTPPRAWVHAVASTRTMTVRDPWVNMLRVTTEMFSGILGGADWVTPLPFDAIGGGSAAGRRVARNTALVLREESFLGLVTDPAAGSYALDTLTDELARKAWARFQVIQTAGGIEAALAEGEIASEIDAGWKARLDAIAKRKIPILGTSEFANLTETLPGNAAATSNTSTHAFPARRDAEPFEALRARADAMPTRPEAVLVTLGPLAESRARAGFAASFFAAGGIASRETTTDGPAAIACICGSDERYATEAVARAKALKAAGAKRILLAGRPAALEAPLREAGVDDFIFVGADVVAVLDSLLGGAS